MAVLRMYFRMVDARDHARERTNVACVHTPLGEGFANSPKTRRSKVHRHQGFDPQPPICIRPSRRSIHSASYSINMERGPCFPVRSGGALQNASSKTMQFGPLGDSAKLFAYVFASWDSPNLKVAATGAEAFRQMTESRLERHLSPELKASIRLRIRRPWTQRTSLKHATTRGCGIQG